jgi:hypothetical protein
MNGISPLMAEGLTASGQGTLNSDTHYPIVSHPSHDELCALIKNGDSIISAEGRNALSKLIGEMDKNHKEYLQKSGFIVSDIPNVTEKVKTETGWLPKYTPMCERALLYAMRSQVAMLDCVLIKKNPDKAQSLSATRLNRKIVDSNEHVFKDSKDRVIREYIDNMKHICQLQKSLGASGELEVVFPVHLKTMQEVERYFEEKMITLTRLSKSLATSPL